MALFDILPNLPGWLHGLVLLGFVVAMGLALWRLLRGGGWPSRLAAQRRLETGSGLPHRPLTALDDRLAAGSRDRFATALWELHRKRLIAQIAGLKVKLPSPVLAAVDKHALRVALCLLLTVGAVTGGPEWRDRLSAAVGPRLGDRSVAPPSRLDIWINPPAYTAVPPVFLDGDAAVGEPVRVPTGSEVLAQVQGTDGVPTLQIGEAAETFESVTSGVHKVSALVTSGDRLAVVQDGRELAGWPIEVLPDRAPEIEFLAPPGRTERSALRLEYGATDDYGLASVGALIRRIDQPEGEPLILDLLLPGGSLRDAESASYHDLTPHPWAGLAVELRLSARDAIGQEGTSDAVRTVLPERIFNHPVARALVELRKQLTLAPDKRFPIRQGLIELSALPEHYFHDVVVALALFTAERRLKYDRSPRAVAPVQQLMWDTALRLEEGELAIAEQDLRRLQEELMRALAEGAPEEEIERLMQELTEALDRFLEALAEQMRQQLAEGQEPQPLQPNTQFLESEQLREMLDRARELARNGARDAARELLSQLQELLENLQANPMAQMGEPGDQNAWQMMREMESLMQQQQDLLDRSYERSRRQSEEGRSLPQSGAQRPTEQGSRSDNQADAQAQDDLRRRLGEMMRELGDALGDIPRPLGRAEQAMRDARDALGREQPGDAVDPQSRALDQLQQGMQAMAERFMEQMGQSQPQRGSGQVGMEPGFGLDPLGRSTGQNGLEALEGVELPEEMELRRAREILDELRRRRGEAVRPPIELDYIDRLLRQF